MCGFGWFVAVLPWTIIGLIHIHLLVWMLILDLVKLALQRKLSYGEHRHPNWYATFLKSRLPHLPAVSAKRFVQPF